MSSEKANDLGLIAKPSTNNDTDMIQHKSADHEDHDTIKEGEGEEHNKQDYHRAISPTQVHVIAMGYCMGSGVFIGTGLSVATGGPGSAVIGYALVCSCIWAVLQVLAEMTIPFPVSGNIFDYADRFVDPSVAFAAGFAEWLAWCAIVGAEATWTHTLIRFWAGDVMPAPASFAILLVLAFVIFLMPVKTFAWFMYFSSIIKILLFLILTATSLAIIGGAGTTGKINNGSTWRDYEPFKDGFSGFASVTLFALWAAGDQIFLGIMGGEAASPRFSMGHATKLVPWRIIAVFMTMIILAGLLVSSSDERLLSGSTVTASPFVIAAIDAGVPGIPHIVNAGIMVAVLSMAVEAIYISSRVMRTMAHQGLIPRVFAQIDSRGRPRWSLLVTLACSVLLTYIQLAAGGSIAFTWLISITSSSFFINWMIISVTSWRFNQAIAAQNDPLFTQPYAWRSSKLASIWLMTCAVFLCFCCVYIGVKPLGGGGFSATNFFQYVIGILLIVIFTLAYKICLRTPWRNPATADLITGRRELCMEELQQLDAYYSMPLWRRLLSYLRLW